MIQHSEELRRVFKGFVKKARCCVKTSVGNLRAAKHRYESLQKPMGRSCLWLLPMIKTALHIAAVRSDKSAQMAKAWLLQITNEACLTLAMLADAADEALLLTRILDNEDVDPATANFEVQMFVNKIEALFGDRMQCLKFGYTAYMLNLLSKPIVWVVGKHTCSIGQEGGVPQSLIDTCLARLRCWVTLAKATLSAEFPHFDFWTSLSVFNLQEGHSPHQVETHLCRVAKPLGLCPSTLQAQYEDVVQRARHVAQVEQLSTPEAWRVTIDRLNARPSIATAHPTDVLHLALVAYIVYGGSTSGVEQGFAKAAWAFTNRRLKAHADTEEAIVKLSLDMPNNSADEVVAVARKVWAHCYGPPREHTVTRVDAGILKRARTSLDMEGGPTQKKPCTEIDFLRARREASRLASTRSPNVDFHSPVKVDGLLGWDAGHVQELKFQEAKLLKRKIQASAEETLLPCEDSAALHLEHDVAHDNMIKEQRARERKAGRVHANAGKTTADVFVSMKRSSVFISHNASSRDLVLALGCHSFKQVKHHWEANVFVVADMSNMGQRVEWASALRGGYVLPPSVICQKKGPILKMAVAVHTPRVIYVSDQCHAQHTGLVDFIMKTANACPGGKWYWLVGNLDEFKRLRTKHAKFPARVIAVVRSDEKLDAEFAGKKHVYNLTEFFKFAQNVSLADCAMGD